MSEQAERDYVRELMASIRAEVVGGHSFANALSQHPRDFPEIYRALVAAGEHTGKLGIVLSRLTDYIEQSNALKQKILLAFTYPGIVTLIAFGIVTFLLSYVVPQVANVFTSTKLQLPTLTVVMLALSDFVRHWWWASFAAAAVLVYAIRKVLSRDAPRLRFDTWLLTAPLAGKLVRGYNTVRFASTLGILTAAGVPILRALQAAGETLSNRAMRANVDDAIVRVREAGAVTRAGAYEDVSAGTRAPDPFGRGDRRRDDDARSRLRRRIARLERRTMFLTSLLEPLLILAMGGVVLVIVLAVMMPIIELNNMVQ